MLISIDSLRPDHLSAYGYRRETSPHLDQVAEQGVIYQDAFAPANWTGAAVTSILTGLYPTCHGYTNRRYYLDEDVPSLATLLSEAGYETLCFSNNMYISRETGLAQGFKHFYYQGARVREGEGAAAVRPAAPAPAGAEYAELRAADLLAGAANRELAESLKQYKGAEKIALTDAYKKAIAAHKKFITDHPDSPLVDSARLELDRIGWGFTKRGAFDVAVALYRDLAAFAAKAKAFNEVRPARLSTADGWELAAAWRSARFSRIGPKNASSRSSRSFFTSP